jgi:c-di-GMP-binding flagellar brake protein YcgR
METRIAQRVKISLEITLRVAKEPRQQFALAEGDSIKVNLLDISRLGMGILSKHFLPRGLIANFEIDGALFGFAETMKIKAEVRWCNYVRPSIYRFGVRFLDNPEKYMNAIEQFVSANERRKEPRLKLSE